ncbi:hypothetical protein RND71_025829 [Anisodus tanguticus]|uniref:RING-type domain-containing protein n=1 Tax=Anisodus tanguticus TaxID=243964 RepID=A0AAE1VAQ6_9SOLA|nr:hypothetical protein RND71_025829 [Anisodus tanguticus]
MTSSVVNLVMTVIGFTVSTIFIVFVCTRLICARIQYLTRRRSSAYTSRSDLSIVCGLLGCFLWLVILFDLKPFKLQVVLVVHLCLHRILVFVFLVMDLEKGVHVKYRPGIMSGGWSLERGLNGLEPHAVANFPTKKYSDEFFTCAEDTQCTVCLAEYRKEDILRILPLCGHYFHATCIDIWFQQQSTCPVCRFSLRKTVEKKCFMQPLFSSAVRSQYAMDSLNVNSNQCSSSSGQRLSSRLHDSQRTDPTTASASNA